jgi:hypothetical protein
MREIEVPWLMFLVMFCVVGVLIAGGWRANIPAADIYRAIELCRNNDGLDGLDRVNADCSNGARFSYRGNSDE